MRKAFHSFFLNVVNDCNIFALFFSSCLSLSLSLSLSLAQPSHKVLSLTLMLYSKNKTNTRILYFR